MKSKKGLLSLKERAFHDNSHMAQRVIERWRDVKQSWLGTIIVSSRDNICVVVDSEAMFSPDADQPWSSRKDSSAIYDAVDAIEAEDLDRLRAWLDEHWDTVKVRKDVLRLLGICRPEEMPLLLHTKCSCEPKSDKLDMYIFKLKDLQRSLAHNGWRIMSVSEYTEYELQHFEAAKSYMTCADECLARLKAVLKVL